MSRPAIFGVLNVTPDSFSDRGAYLDPHAAIEAGLRMVEEGADWIDVGGESTRPGAEPVPADEELRRVLPVVESLAKEGVAVSIDTSKASVAKVALAAGARLVNDVGALRDPDMAPTCAAARCDVVLMHMRGAPATMQIDPRYDDVVAEVRRFLVERARFARSEGIERVWIDPGIGFGKTLEHNLRLLSRLDAFVGTGFPVLIGVSRKSFIGAILDEPNPRDRLEGTLAAQVLAQVAGVAAIRAHDVRAARRAADVAAAILDRR